jgi:hypothetical protein
VPAGGAEVTFKNNFNTEPTFDGMVLEISIAAVRGHHHRGRDLRDWRLHRADLHRLRQPIAGRCAWNGTLVVTSRLQSTYRQRPTGRTCS